jgi:hypothetical protein
VVSETIVDLWKAPERLFNSIALIAFFLAVCGESVSYKYNSRRNVLYQAQEQQVRDSAAGEVNRPHHEAAAKKIADSDQHLPRPAAA